MMRVGLFILTNLAVMFVFGIILSIFGVNAHSTLGLLIFAAIFGFGGSFISLLLSKRMALSSVGGKIITNPRNAQEQWLVDIVSRQANELKIKTPEVAIYQAEDINAFATGATKNNSLVAVSSGLLAAMTQDEAEAVIGHEMIFETGFGILASLIAMWFSRYREFHADAGSAKLVGSTKMIAALEKLKLSHEPNEEASILAFCINGEKKARLSQLFLSHQPLEKRIEALRNQSYIA